MKASKYLSAKGKCSEVKKSLFSLLFLLFLIPGAVSAEDNRISGWDSWENTDITMSGVTAKTYPLIVANDVKAVNTLEGLSAVIYEKMKNYEINIIIPFKGDTSNLMNELEAMFTEFGLNDDYYYGTLSKWQYGYNGYANDVTITIKVEYLTNAQQELIVDEQVQKIKANLLKPGMSDVQKVKAVNDYIVLNTAYSFNTVTSPHAVYAILNEGKGVCQAYALLAYRLLNEMGMEVRYVVGEAGGIGHAWNLVKVDGEWYQLDTTWNDPLPDRDGIVGYNYFLISDKVIGKDHFWERSDYVAATSEKYSFFQDIYHLTSLNDYLIYSSISNDNKLYRLNLATKELVKIADTRALYPVAKGEWVYFSDFNNSGYLTKVKIDGTSKTLLNKVYSTNLAIEGNILSFKKRDNSYGTVLLEGREEPVAPSEDELAAKHVIEQINYLKEQEAVFRKDVQAVRALYNNLTVAAKVLVTNISVLIDTELEIVQALIVDNLISVLNPTSASFKEDVVAARTAYEALSTSAKSKVLYLTELKDAEQLVNDWGQIEINPKRFDRWSEKQITDIKKEWIISFSSGIDRNTVTTDNVYIIDTSGNKLAFAKLEFLSTKQIQITNTGVFIKGKTYYVVIEDSVKSLQGKQLKKGIYMPFKIQ